MVSLDASPVVTLALGAGIVAVVVAGAKAVVDELRGGTDTLSLTSVLLVVTGSVASFGTSVVGFDDDHPLVLGALVVVALGILLRIGVWFRDRESASA